MVSDHLNDFAQKAGEAFVAAGRAQTPEQRALHRASAQDYQEVLGKMRGRRRGGKPVSSKNSAGNGS